MMSFAPARTPLFIKILLGMIFLSSVFSFLISPYLALSLEGVQHLYLWQFSTYLFIHPFPSTIIYLAFNLYLLWIFGASLLERVHLRSFLCLFLGSGIFSGITAWIAMTCFHLSSPFYGCSPAVQGLLVAWMILNPAAELLLFFSFPLKARHLILAFIGVNLLIDLSRSNWASLFAYLGAIVFGYFCTLIQTRQYSSFPSLLRFENGFFHLIDLITCFGKKKAMHAKIYDIKSGEPVWNDEQFMDAMLARISLYGEEALSPQEKRKMQQISASKKVSEK